VKVYRHKLEPMPNMCVESLWDNLPFVAMAVHGANTIWNQKQGRGNREVSGVKLIPPEIYLGVNHGILTPPISLERNIFWYTPTRC